MTGHAPTTDLQSSNLIRTLAAAKVLPDPTVIAERVENIKRSNPTTEPEVLAKRVVISTTRRLAGIGAAASLPSVIPGPGTGAQIALTGSNITAETWAVLRELSAMQLTVAGLYGHSVHGLERRDELLLVWGIETGAIVPFTETTKLVGEKVAVAQLKRHLSGAMLKRLNARLGRQIFTKFGTKRGSIALGRVAPFGVGVAHWRRHELRHRPQLREGAHPLLRRLAAHQRRGVVV